MIVWHLVNAMCVQVSEELQGASHVVKVSKYGILKCFFPDLENFVNLWKSLEVQLMKDKLMKQTELVNTFLPATHILHSEYLPYRFHIFICADFKIFGSQSDGFKTKI